MIISDDVVDDESELVHYVFYADIDPINVVEELKDSKWMHAMVDELNSIEDNKTWPLVELPQSKKAIDMKWVYKVKLNLKVEVTRHKVRLSKGISLEKRN